MTLRNAKRTQTLPLIGCNLIKITEISILVKSRGIAVSWRIPLGLPLPSGCNWIISFGNG